MRRRIIEICNRIWKDIRLNWVGLAAVAVCLTLFAVLFDSVCPMQIIFGLPCPGCGLTRAGILVLTGHFIKAWQMHPFIYGWIAIVLYISYNRYIKARRSPGLNILLMIMVISMFVFYCYRMYYYFPNVEPMNRAEHYILKNFRQ